MDLHHYLSRLQTTIFTRREIEVKELRIAERPHDRDVDLVFRADLWFYDGSRLQIVEQLSVDRQVIKRVRYGYHYQRADETLIFRYDNVPHHPEVETFPHHKHEGGSVVEAQPPDLSDVLREIDALLYPETD